MDEGEGVARQLLIRSLEKLRKQFDEGTDDWRYVLLKVFREYLRALGVERRLVDPLEKMLLEAGDAVMRTRGEKGVARQTSSAVAMAYAAAAVTALKLLHDVSVPAALSSVSKLSGIDKRKLQKFRDSLSRGPRHWPAGAHETYEAALAEMRDRAYSPDDILEAATGLGAYLGKDPP